MNRERFKIGDLVYTGRALFSFQDDNLLPLRSVGYLTAIYHNVAFVKFAHLDRPVAIRYADLRQDFRDGDRVSLSALRLTAWDGTTAWLSI